LYLAELTKEAVSPLARVEAGLHPWTSYLVVPLFALANAGVSLSAHALSEALTSPVAAGIVAGHVVGKLVGIMLACWICVRFARAPLPADGSWPQMLGVATAAGVAFTVALFIAELALPRGLINIAKVAIVASAAIASCLGLLILRTVRRRQGSGPGDPPA
jgi:NhaA family Na+:H+ antiporter